MDLIHLGLSHKTAPIEVRERFAVPGSLLEAATRQLISLPEVSGAVLISTCNRTEVFADSVSEPALNRWFTDRGRAQGVEVDRALYAHHSESAVRHAFRVASGIDSLILGEPQILGQVKQAVQTARLAGALSGPLDRLFQQTFAVAKQVRSQTAIGQQSVSFAAAAVKLAERIFGQVTDLSVLFVGVGEMMELAATHFCKERPKRIFVANRGLLRAEAFAARFGGEALPLSAMPDRLAACDVVVSGTASPLPVIGKGMVGVALRERRHRPMLLLDFAVPRDIEPGCADYPDVFLYGIDELGKLAQQALGERQAAAQEAEQIIARESAAFVERVAARAATPLIVALRGRAEEYRQIELDRARRLLQSGQDPALVLESLSRSLTNKLLHHPSQALGRAGVEERNALAGLLERLFPAVQNDS
jgi:glutamyl-tRNA reductase